MNKENVIITLTNCFIFIISSSLYQFFQINYIIEKIEKQFNQYTNNKLMNSSFHSLA